MESKYWIFIDPTTNVAKSIFKAEADPITETVQAYAILYGKWEPFDHLWEMLADNDMRVDPLSNDDAEKLIPLMLKPENVEKMSLVSKATDERRFTLGPMYVPDSLDAHGEWTDADELQKAVWDYVRKGDRRIRLQHNRDVVAGEWVEIMTFPYTMSVPMNKADGSRTDLSFPKDTVFLGVVWEPWAWELIKRGELRGYSIGGKAERLYVDLEDVQKEDPTSGGVHVDTIMGQQPSAELPKRKKKKDVRTEEQ